MLELEEQIAEYFDYLDGLNADEPMALATSRAGRTSRRSLALIAACLTVLVVAAVWLFVRESPSPTRGVSPAATTEAVPSDGTVLPERIAVLDTAGNLAGFVDRDALREGPGTRGISYDAWLREPIPVTKSRDPQSQLVGYKFRTAGFVDLATYESPDFDLDALIAAAQADSTDDSNQFTEGRDQQGTETPPQRSPLPVYDQDGNIVGYATPKDSPKAP